MCNLQERFEFLAKYRHTVPEEDFEMAMKAYEWPKKFVSIMKEAAAKATSGQTQSICCKAFGRLLRLSKQYPRNVVSTMIKPTCS